jgi:hypothetical protein
VNFLEAVFNSFKAKSTSKYFWMEHWISLLESLEVVNNGKLRIGILQAKLIFVWSKVNYALAR